MPSLVEEKGKWLPLSEIIQELRRFRHPDGSGKPPVVAISISGGGATCAYQGGALKAFFEAIKDYPELRPKMVVATSGGALNAFVLLLEQLELVRHGDEPLLSLLWQIIGAKNKGSRFVVTRKNRWLFDFLTRWMNYLGKLGADAKRLLDSPLKKGLGVVAAILVAIVLHKAIPFGVLLFLIAATFSLTAAVRLLLDRSLFNNQRLHNTLINAVLAGEISERSLLNQKLSKQDEKQAAEILFKRWIKTLAKDQELDLMITSTDISFRGEALFSLVSPDVYKELVKNNWQVYQIADEEHFKAYRVEDSLSQQCGRVAPEELFQCLLSSTSIPGIFPAREITLCPNHGGEPVAHQFVDGGMLNNSPLHVAIDAGATHVISFELNPVAESAPLAKGGSAMANLNVLEDVAETFSTVVGLSTTEDIRRAASWNRWLDKYPTPEKDKRVVPIYRLGPLKEECGFGIVDFDGHYESPFKPSITVMDWFNTGFRDANLPRYWDATFCSAPSCQPAVDAVCV